MYTLGRVVIWSNHKSFDSSKGFENLKEPWIKKIAIYKSKYMLLMVKKSKTNYGIFKYL